MAITDKIISFWKQVKLKSSDMFTLFRVGVGVKVPTHKLHVKDSTDPLKIEGLQNETSDPDKFLTIDSNNVVKYRTGAQIASDIEVNIDDLHAAGVDGSANQLLTDDGDGTVTSEAYLEFSDRTLTIGENSIADNTIKGKEHSDGAGANLLIQAGTATAGGSTNSDGGDLRLYGGNSTGSGDGGFVSVWIANSGSSGTSANSFAERVRFDYSSTYIYNNLVLTGDATIYGNDIVFYGTNLYDGNETTLNGGTPSADRTITLPDATGTVALTSQIPVDLTVSGSGTVHTNNITDLHGAGIDGSAGNLLTDDGDGTVTSQPNLTYISASEVFTLTSSTSAKPMFQISNSNTDAEAPVISLIKSTAGADGDDLGRIKFDGYDPDGNAQTFAQILGEIVVAADGSEEGKLTIIVASHDGEEKPGLILASGNAEDEVDVTIGNEATSLTTIAGDLQVNGNDIKDDDGTTCLTFDSSGNTVASGSFTCSASSGASLFVNHTSASGSPFIAFNQDGTRRSFIQHHNTDDKFRFASEFGAIALEAASSGGSDSNTAYLVIDPGGTFTLGAQDSDVVLTTDGNMTFRVDSDNDETNGSFIFQHNASTQIATLTEDGNFATSGVVTAAKGHKYNLTDNTDGSHQGDIVYIDAATASTTAGKVYYLNSSGSWTISNADAEADASGMLAVALGSDPDVDGMLLRGMVTAADIAGTPAVGAAVYLRGTDGILTTDKPTTSGHIVRHAGYILDATHDQIWFNPDSTYIEI